MLRIAAESATRDPEEKYHTWLARETVAGVQISEIF
jgi:hypothetical protein